MAKKLNLDVVGFVVSISLVIIATVAIVHPTSISFNEKIPLFDKAGHVQLEVGMGIQLQRRGVLIYFPDCENIKYQDRFMMHVYAAVPSGAVSKNFINLDFNPSAVESRSISINGVKNCVIFRQYTVPNLGKLHLGQYRLSDGKCCNVLWSRIYVVDK